ncbi:hypothetical protein [Vibrio hangzhouensis]|uniref:hypothetical protein n=1 Tax=Vibrio hangzhouensis TaxID=462991 RepID=UPI001C9818FB|nr:hypothetical protein [Vibrio hangzhouensis]MBY6196085.1 hypothetical protein [Vibrio hangzhouensis]
MKRSLFFGFVSVLLLAGCGDSESDDNQNPVSVSGRDTSDITVYSSNEVMNFPREDMQGNLLCNNTASKFATENFIIGSNDNVSEATLTSIIASTQKSLNLHKATMGLTDTDLDLSNGEKLEICIATSEGRNGAGSMGGIIVGTGRSGADLDLLLDHELVHTIGDRITGNASISAYSHRWFDEGIAEMFSGDGVLTQMQMIELLAGDDIPNPAQVEHKGAEDVWLFADKNASYWYPAYNTTLHYLMSEGLTKTDIISIYKNFRTIHDACEANMVAVYNDTGKGINIENKDGGPYSSAYYYGRIACFDKFRSDDPVRNEIDNLYPNVDLTSYRTLDPLGSGQYVHSENIFELALNSVIGSTNVISYQNLKDNFNSLVTYGYLQN